MLIKTRGIVLKFFKYRETSIIVKIFTDSFGLQTYIVNSVRSKSSKGKIALYQPLTLLDMVVYHKESADINRISEVKCSAPFISISLDIKKVAIAIFLAEIMYKCIKEQGDVKEMYQFIHSSIIFFDHMERGYESFHLQFLLKFSKYLGFGVGSDDHLLGVYDKGESKLLSELLLQPYDHPIKISNEIRRNLLQDIIVFYGKNVESLKEINSVKVLHEIL